jgi:hypothetical protein
MANKKKKSSKKPKWKAIEETMDWKGKKIALIKGYELNI